MIESVDTNLPTNVINDVESDEVLQEMLDNGELEEEQLYFTPSGLTSSEEGTLIIWEVWE